MSQRSSASSHTTCSRSGRASSEEPQFLPSLPAPGLAGTSGTHICSAHSEQRLLFPGFGGFLHEGSSIGISSAEMMLHLKTSRFPWSLASGTAENHKSVESTLGTDRPRNSAPVLCCAAGAGRDEPEDAWEHRIPTAAWLLGPLCHLPCTQETLPGSPGCDKAAPEAAESAVLREGLHEHLSMQGGDCVWLRHGRAAPAPLQPGRAHVSPRSRDRDGGAVARPPQRKRAGKDLGEANGCRSTVSCTPGW